MLVHVLLYDAGQDSEGIHSLELSGSTVVLMFENPDDAERYAGLLRRKTSQFPIEALDREEIEIFCRQAATKRGWWNQDLCPRPMKSVCC